MDIAALKTILIHDEGLKLRPYRDSIGKLTIGIGRNLDDVGITATEADFMLGNDIQKVQIDLNRALSWWIILSERRQLVLASMCFNMGISTLLGFKNTLADMKEGRYKEAAEGMRQSKWATQVGDRAERLAVMMEEG